MTTYQRQCLLGYLGYYGGWMDGQWGALSAAACRAFQHDHGLEEDGICGEKSQKMLIDAVAGTAVREDHSTKIDTDSAGIVENSTIPGKTGTFWDDIRWFTREEFRCQCGGRYCSGYPAEMQEAVVRIADAAREHFGRPGHVVSGLRCEKWNAHEGGVANSQHMYGEAIDLRLDGVDSETLRQFVSTQPGHRYSYRINDTNVHFDMEKTGRDAHE